MTLHDDSPVTIANMKFLDRNSWPQEEKLYNILYVPNDGLAMKNFDYEEEKAVPIRDLRPKKGSISLDNEGFMILDLQSALEYKDFYDENALKEAFIPEIHALLVKSLGAKAVFVHECVIRNRDLKPDDSKRFGTPIPQVHTDYTLEYIKTLIGYLAGKNAGEVLKRRFQMLNLWKPLKGPLQDWPLALCDVRSVSPNDLVAMDEVHRTAALESHAVQYNNNQKWYFLSEMQTDEILVFKSADSHTKGSVPHCSFQDPRYPGAEPRESLELRVLVVY